MPQIAFETWVGEISLRVNGAPEPVILGAIRRSAQQFCGDTRIWNQSLGSASVQPPAVDSNSRIDVPSDDYSLPAMSRLIAISDVLLDGTSLTNDSIRERVRTGLLDGDRVFRYDAFEETLTIAEGAIQNAGMLEIRGTFSPDDDATAIPAALGRWKLAVIDRTLYELMLMPNRDWTNRVIAGDHLTEYKLRVAEATVAKSGEGTTTPVRSARIAAV